MKKLSFPFLSTILVLGVALQIAAQERISPAEAAKYVGKNATVCGQVASANFSARRTGSPIMCLMVAVSSRQSVSAGELDYPQSVRVWTRFPDRPFVSAS